MRGQKSRTLLCRCLSPTESYQPPNCHIGPEAVVAEAAAVVAEAVALQSTQWANNKWLSTSYIVIAAVTNALVAVAKTNGDQGTVNFIK